MQDHPERRHDALKACLARIADRVDDSLLHDLKSSSSLKRLFQLGSCHTFKESYLLCSGVLVSLKEIEKDIFMQTSTGPKSPSDCRPIQHTPQALLSLQRRSQTSPYVYTSILQHSGCQHLFTLWMFLFQNLLDRAIVTSVYLNAFRTNKSAHVWVHNESLVLFQQSLLWNLRVLWLTSYFGSMSTQFGKRAILRFLYGPAAADSISILPPSHPIAQLRFFFNDVVFVSEDPHTELGGGFVGFLALGSSTVGVAEAARKYGEEILAQRELLKYIIRLKIDVANTRCNDTPDAESTWLPLHHVLQTPLTHLNPLLACVVDYHGLRIFVHPLYHRPPLELVLDGLPPSVSQEIAHLNQNMFSLQLVCPDTALRLLHTQEQSMDIITFHNAYRLLLREVPQTPRNFSVSHHFRPLAVANCALALAQGCFTATRDSHTTQTRYATTDAPFTLAAFPPFRALRFNPFIMPDSDAMYGNMAANKKILRAPAHPRVDVYLTTSVIGQVVKLLEQQPFHGPHDSPTLTQWLHASGLNARYLGRLIVATRHAWLQQMFLVEIVSRSLKHFMRDVVHSACFGPIAHDHVFSTDHPVALHPQSHQRIESFLMKHFSTSAQFMHVLVELLLQHVSGPSSSSTLWEILGLNLLLLVVDVSNVSDFLWKSVICIYAAELYQCSEHCIQRDACPTPAFITSFLYHTGLHFDQLLDISESAHIVNHIKHVVSTVMCDTHRRTHVASSTHPSTLDRRASLQGCVSTFKCTADLPVLETVLPLFSMLNAPSTIPLRLNTTVRVKVSDPPAPEPPTTTTTTTTQDTDGASSFCVPSQRPTPVQEFIASNVRLSCAALDSIPLLGQRQFARHVLNANTHHVQRASPHVLRPSYQLIPELRSILSLHNPKLASSTLNTFCVVQRKKDTFTFSTTLVDLASLAMAYHEWSMAAHIALDAYTTFPKHSLASIRCRWVLCWAQFFDALAYENAIPHLPLKVQHTVHETFLQCVARVDNRWGHCHPLTGDTLIGYAWIFYVMKDYAGCRRLLDAAAHHVQKITFHRSRPHALDACHPDTAPMLCTENVRCAEKTGQLYRLLGTLFLNDAQTGIHSNTRNPQEIADLLQKAVHYLSKALDYLCLAYKKHPVDFLVASPLYEMGVALLTTWRHTVETRNQRDIHQLNRVLKLFVTSFKIRTRILPLYHFEVIHTALYIACLLEDLDQSKLSIKLFEQVLKDIPKLRLWITRICKDTDAATHTVTWDVHRPRNLFTLLLWSLPNAHFIGIHELTENPHQQASTRLDLSQCYTLRNFILKRAYLPHPRFIQQRIFFNYINCCITRHQLSRTFILFHHFHDVKTRIDAWRSTPSLINYTLLKKVYHDNMHDVSHHVSGQPMHMSHLLVDNQTMFLQYVRNYPRLLSQEHLITLLYTAADPHKSTQAVFESLLFQSQQDLRDLEQRMTPGHPGTSSPLNPPSCSSSHAVTTRHRATNTYEGTAATYNNAELRSTEATTRPFFSTLNTTSSPSSSSSVSPSERYASQQDDTLHDSSTLTNSIDVYEPNVSPSRDTTPNSISYLRGACTHLSPAMVSRSDQRSTSRRQNTCSPLPFSGFRNALMYIQKNGTQHVHASHKDRRVSSFPSPEKGTKRSLSFVTRFLDIHDPHQLYSLSTPALDILFSLFYWFLDVSQFNQRLVSDLDPRASQVLQTTLSPPSTKTSYTLTSPTLQSVTVQGSTSSILYDLKHLFLNLY